MAATGHGATFTFTCDRGTFNGGVTKISVDSPTAEVVDMTGGSDDVGLNVLVPTGAWKGGSVAVEYVAGSGFDVQLLVRGYGSLTFTSPGMSVSRQVLLESASRNASVGDVVRGSLKFLMTDYYG